MNLLDLRNRIREKAIEAGLAYSEIETLSDTNELLNQTMPALFWEYDGESNDFEQNYSEITLNIYVLDNFNDSEKVESASYQRDFIVTKKNALREKYILFLKSLSYESSNSFIQVVREEQTQLPERVAIENFIFMAAKITIQKLRDFCIDVEEVEVKTTVGVYFNGVLRYSPLNSTDLELNLIDTLGDPITATFDGLDVIIDTGTCADASYIVEYEDGTEIESGTIASGASKTIVVPDPTPLLIPSGQLNKTGQTTIYRSGDDGDTQRGKLIDFYTLSSNNPFGNTDRFTNILGGQTYANNIVVDWSTFNGSFVLCYYRVLYNDRWSACIDYCNALIVDGFNGWSMPNRIELINIVNHSLNNVLNYSPFNIATNLWTSTTLAASTANAYVLGSNGASTTTAKTNAATRTIAVRNFTLAELGL